MLALLGGEIYFVLCTVLTKSVFIYELPMSLFNNYLLIKSFDKIVLRKILWSAQRRWRHAQLCSISVKSVKSKSTNKIRNCNRSIDWFHSSSHFPQQSENKNKLNFYDLKMITNMGTKCSCQTFACFLGAVSRHFCDPGNQQKYIRHFMPGFFIWLKNLVK